MFTIIWILLQLKESMGQIHKLLHNSYTKVLSEDLKLRSQESLDNETEYSSATEGGHGIARSIPRRDAYASYIRVTL